MQRIERYGVLALVFLLVTIVTFALWDDDAKPGTEVAAAEPTAEAAARERLSSTDRARAAREAQLREAQRRQAERNRAKADAPARDDLRSRLENAEAQKNASQLVDRTRRSNNSGGITRTNKPSIDGQRPKYDLDIGVDATRNAPKTAPESQPVTSNPSTDDRTAARNDMTRRMDDARRKREHVVRSGETLSQIAEQELGSTNRWHEIAALNPSVDPNRLSVGQTLTLPGPGSAPVDTSVASAPRPQSTTTTGPGGSYTIQSGDVLSRIAQDRLGSVKRTSEILALNPGLDPTRLYVGQVIALPAGASTSAPRDSAMASARNTPSRSSDDRPRVR